MRAIIVEDEEPARELLKNFLANEHEISIVGEYGDGFSGAVAINRDKPDLVFLDIQLPKINGFELLELLDFSPQIIFTTAYDEFAIKAFDQNATDYLLKPFSKERLLKAVAKAKEKQDSSTESKKSPVEMADDLSSSIQLNRIVVKDAKGINVIPVNDINYFEAQDDYVMIYTSRGRFMKKQTLKYLEQRLDPEQFIRIHRTYIVNALEIQRIEPYEKDSYIAILNNNSRLKISSSGYKSLKERMGF